MYTGQYTCYIREGLRWYLCDDATISMVDEGIVCAGNQVYMAFYGFRVSLGLASGVHDICILGLITPHLLPLVPTGISRQTDHRGFHTAAPTDGTLSP
jgi:hypothetical protein